MHSIDTHATNQSFLFRRGFVCAMITLGARCALAKCTLSEQPSNYFRITGYYTPLESDYGWSGDVDTVAVFEPESHNDVEKLTFPSKFLHDTSVEGWGKTNAGWYLGFLDGSWVRSDYPQNARGKPLVAGRSAATDYCIIGKGRQFKLYDLPLGWGTKIFVADDTGGLITGNHIDIYCGLGEPALRIAKAITTNAGKNIKISYVS